MLAFYGHSVDLPSRIAVEATCDRAEQSTHWLTPGNHNQLRITRMLRSMCLLGQGPSAQSWYRFLCEVGIAHSDAITPRTLQFWEEAVSGGSEALPNSPNDNSSDMALPVHKQNDMG